MADPKIIEAEFVEEVAPRPRDATIHVHVDAGELVRELVNAPQTIAAEMVARVARRIPERGAPLPRNGGPR